MIADVRKDAVDTAVVELRAGGHDVIGVPTDVSKLSEIEALAEATFDTFGAVHVLCNKAGVGGFARICGDHHRRLGADARHRPLGSDLRVKVFLPLIEKEAEGHISSTASVAGLFAGAASGPSNVAKHGVVALMATLERERRAAKSPVHASVLCPRP